MGSVTEIIKCPRCKIKNCLHDLYYKTGESIVQCLECGYHYEFLYKRDDEGNYIMKDETKGYKPSNFIPVIYELEKPFGTYSVKLKRGGSSGSLKTEDDYQNFVSEIVSLSKQEHNMEKVIVSRFLDGEIKKEVIFSNGTNWDGIKIY